MGFFTGKMPSKESKILIEYIQLPFDNLIPTIVSLPVRYLVRKIKYELMILSVYVFK